RGELAGDDAVVQDNTLRLRQRIEHSPQPGIGRHGDHGLARKICEAHASLSVQLVPTRQDQTAVLLDDRLDDDLPMPFGNGADAEVGEAATYILEHAARNPLPDLNEDPGMALTKDDQRGRHDMVSDRYQAGDDELTAQPTVQLSDRLRMLHELAQQALRDR